MLYFRWLYLPEIPAWLYAVNAQLRYQRSGDIMNLINNFITLSQQSDAEKPSLFPFPFSMHFVFVCVSVLFFIYRFSVQKRPYQLIMAAAIFVSMGVWISDNRTLYYAIGAIELVLILCAVVSSFIFREKKTEGSSEDKSDDDSSGDDNNGGDDDESGSDDEDEMTAINAATTVNNILNN